jgi:hypothetical protein
MPIQVGELFAVDHASAAAMSKEFDGQERNRQAAGVELDVVGVR